VVDAILLPLQPRGLAGAERARGDTLVDAALLVGLALIHARGVGLRLGGKAQGGDQGGNQGGGKGFHVEAP
jgi:hypothetical protein